MVLKAIKCVICDSENIVKNGTQSNGVQRLLCKDCGKSFQAEYTNNGAKIETKFMIIKMSVNGSGIRDIARVLEISPDTVLDVLKKLKIFLSMSTRNMQTLYTPSR
jgi:transposase-like protein